MKLPSPSAVPVPTLLPSLSYTLTVEFGSALPVTLYPSVEFPVVATSVGAAGATTSSAGVFVGAASLSPFPFLAVTVKSASAPTDAGTSIVKLPSPSAVPVPTSVPSLS